MTLARVSAGKVEEADLAWIRSATEKYRDADAALVLGWYAFDRSDWADAETWFGRSLAWKESPSAAEGLARTYMEQHRFEQAGALAAAWRERAPAFAPILADVERQRLWSDLEGTDPRQTLQVTTRLIAQSGTADPAVLIARGWALYGLERPSEAALAFREAMEKTEAGSPNRGDAVYGLVHAEVKSGLVEDGRALLQDSSLSEDQRRRLEQVVTSQEAIDAYHDGRHDESLQLVRRLQGSETDGSLAALEAWNLLELGRYGEARAAFTELYGGYQSPEALKGMRVVEARTYRHD
jgi:tetratricopeptide (TPR) repeat protein